MLNDAPAFRSYEAASQMVAVSVEVPISNMRRERELRASMLTFRCLRLELSSLRECSGPEMWACRVLLKLLQEYADFRVHLTLTLNQYDSQESHSILMARLRAKYGF